MPCKQEKNSSWFRTLLIPEDHPHHLHRAIPHRVSCAAGLLLMPLLLVDLVGLKMVFIYPSPGVLYRNGSSNSSSKGKDLEYAWVSFSALNPHGFLPISDVRRLISLEYTVALWVSHGTQRGNFSRNNRKPEGGWLDGSHT